MGERVVRAGFAVELTLRNFSFARAPFSGWLLRAPPAVTAALSVATWWAEIAALPLLLCPLAPLLARCVAVATFLGFHTGLGIMMRLGAPRWDSRLSRLC